MKRTCRPPRGLGYIDLSRADDALSGATQAYI